MSERLTSAGRIITFGLSKEQNAEVNKALPSKDCELFETDAPTDLIAISAAAYIINAAALDALALSMLFGYYEENGGCRGESVFWLGEPLPPTKLQTGFMCYDTFESFAVNLKYHLLTARSRAKTAEDFSRRLSYCLQIMKLIRNKPYIRTQELAQKLELSVRTVQRYIVALQQAGEWVEYDLTKKGWYLQNGVSPLLDNF